MTIQIREMRQEDVERCGRICHAAFGAIAERHNFRPDFPVPEAAIELAQAFYASPDVFSVVAEQDGKVIGSNHLWEYDAIRAVGPITVDPEAQAKGAGRMLMEAVIERGKQTVDGKTPAGIRLVQDAFNSTSLSLYTSLGFDVKEPLALIEGELHGAVPPEVTVRPIHEADYARCAELCRMVHGFDRLNELKNTPPSLTSFVAIRDGRIVAYASAPQFWPLNHAVAETESDMHAVLTGAANLAPGQPLSFLLPVRQSSLFRWCLEKRLRVLKMMNLMTMGEYQEPRSCYLPSVGY
ncbi:MAG TPA: GNAT family N-acetyltransferase [Pyrinomonadaceae bacterium]|nr:GNAT family N-acetyltransferase [Pyrinomonadaceae bacterium]